MYKLVPQEDPWSIPEWYDLDSLEEIQIDLAFIICNAFPENITPFEHRHMNHPWTHWVKRTTANLEWAINLLFAAGFEYEKRTGREHPSYICMHTFLRMHIADNIAMDGNLTPWPR